MDKMFNAKREKKISELEKRIIQAEIEKVARPYNKNECDVLIKSSYKAISAVRKESEEAEQTRNNMAGAALAIIGLFIFAFYVSAPAGQTFQEPQFIQMDKPSSVTGFAVFEPANFESNDKTNAQTSIQTGALNRTITPHPKKKTNAFDQKKKTRASNSETSSKTAANKKR